MATPVIPKKARHVIPTKATHVIPTKVGIQLPNPSNSNHSWIPAFAGMTARRSKPPIDRTRHSTALRVVSTYLFQVHPPTLSLFPLTKAARGSYFPQNRGFVGRRSQRSAEPDNHHHQRSWSDSLIRYSPLAKGARGSYFPQNRSFVGRRSHRSAEPDNHHHQRSWSDSPICYSPLAKGARGLYSTHSVFPPFC